MATELNLSKESKEVKDLTKSLVDLTKTLRGLKKEISGTQKAFNDQSKSQSEVANKAKQVQTANQKLSDIQKERVSLINKLNKANSNSIQRNEELKLQLAKQNKANKELARSKLGLIGAYEKEAKKLADLRKKYKDVATAQGTNSKQSKKLRKEIGQLDGKLSKVNVTGGKASSMFNQMPGPMGRVQSSVMMVIGSLKLLAKVIFTTPLGWLIAIIGGAIAAMSSFFTSSEEGQDRWNKVMTKSKVVLNNFKDELAKAGKALIEFRDDIAESEEGVKGLFKRLGEDIKTDFQKLKDTIKDEGFFKALGKSMANPFIFAKEKLNEFTEENRRELKIAEDLANRQAKLDRLERDSLVKLAVLRRDINLLRETAAKKEDVDAQTRLVALNEAIILENKILDINVSIASEKANLKTIQNSLSLSNKEDLNEEAQLRAALIDQEASAARKRKLLQAELVTTQREILTEEKKLEDERQTFVDELFADDIEQFEAQLEKEQDLEIKATEDTIKQQEELKKAARDEELEDFKLLLAAKDELEQSAIGAAQQIASDQFSSFIDNNLNSFREGQEAQEQVLKNRLDKGEISEKEYEKKIKALKLKTRQEEAKAEKKKALFDVAINTAIEIAKVLSKPFLIPIVAAIGATQAAVIAARPIPKFKFGGKKQTEGMAGFSESGSELMVLPGGQSLLTPEKETIGFVPAGTKFFSHDSPETRTAMEGGITNAKFDELISEQRATRKAINDQKSYTWTRKGLEERDRKANMRRLYVGKYLR